MVKEQTHEFQPFIKVSADLTHMKNLKSIQTAQTNFNFIKILKFIK